MITRLDFYEIVCTGHHRLQQRCAEQPRLYECKCDFFYATDFLTPHDFLQCLDNFFVFSVML